MLRNYNEEEKQDYLDCFKVEERVRQNMLDRIEFQKLHLEHRQNKN